MRLAASSQFTAAQIAEQIGMRLSLRGARTCIKRKRLCSAAGKAVSPDVIASSPSVSKIPFDFGDRK